MLRGIFQGGVLCSKGVMSHQHLPKCTSVATKESLYSFRRNLVVEENFVLVLDFLVELTSLHVCLRLSVHNLVHTACSPRDHRYSENLQWPAPEHWLCGRRLLRQSVLRQRKPAAACSGAQASRAKCTPRLVWPLLFSLFCV